MADQPTTLITGTRRGIGHFLARYYVEQGHYVVGCSRHAVDWSLSRYEHLTLDVSDEGAVISAVNHVRETRGRVDNLINNAGVASMNHALLTPGATLQRIFATNVLGTFLFCREAAKSMKGAPRARIVNFTTVAAPLKLEGEAAYAASKDAVRSLTQILARELAPLRITVNAVGPTPIDTDLTRAVPKDKLAKLVARQAIQRFGEFADVANVVDFYLSPRSDFITGQCIYLGGV